MKKPLKDSEVDLLLKEGSGIYPLRLNFDSKENRARWASHIKNEFTFFNSFVRGFISGVIATWLLMAVGVLAWMAVNPIVWGV